MTVEREPELWKPLTCVPEVAGLYEISSHGRIKSLPRWKHIPNGGKFLSKEKILKLIKMYRGYTVVQLSNMDFSKSHFSHILTAKTFCDNPNGCGFVNHDNGNKEDNYYKNLIWCTRSENMIHAFKSGLISKRRKRKAC